MRTNIPSFRLPAQVLDEEIGDDRRHGRGPAPGLARRQPARRCSTRASTTRCSSAPARRRARSSSCRAVTRPREQSHPHRHRLARVGGLRAHRQDRRARADHRRRQHGDGLLPHFAASGREERQGHGAQAARLLQGFGLGARGCRGGERRDRHQPRAQGVRDRERQAGRHEVREDGVRHRQGPHQGRARGRRGVHSLRRRDPRHRPGERLPLDRARPRHRVRQVGRAGGRQGHVPVHAPGSVLRRRCGLRPEEHHLGGGARTPGRDLDPQALPAASRSPSGCRPA